MNKYHPDRRYMMDSQYDNLFKAIISAGWNVSSDGHVEAPTGFFALVEIPSHTGELLHMQEAVDPDELYVDLPWPDAGWYVTTENSDGLIFVFEFPTKVSAQKSYDGLASEYSSWGSDENESDNG